MDKKSELQKRYKNVQMATLMGGFEGGRRGI